MNKAAVVEPLSPGLNPAVKPKKHYIDILRTIAIYLLVLAHSGIVMEYYTNDSRHWVRLLCMFEESFARCGPDLFFVISGGLLLAREESLGELYGKRVFRHLLVIVIFSFISYVYELYMILGLSFREIWLRHYLLTMYSSLHYEPYWFMYSYLAYLVMLPLLRRMAQGMGRGDFLYFIGIMFALPAIESVMCIVTGGEVFTYSPSFNLYLAAAFCPLMGYFIERRIEDRHFCLKNCLIAAGAVLLMLIIGTFIGDRYLIIAGSGSLCGIWWPHSACGFYFIAKCISHMRARKGYTPSKGLRKLLEILGGASFSIFLMDQIFRTCTAFIYRAALQTMSKMGAGIIWSLCAWALGVIVATVLRQIPGLKKLL